MRGMRAQLIIVSERVNGGPTVGDAVAGICQPSAELPAMAEDDGARYVGRIGQPGSRGYRPPRFLAFKIFSRSRIDVSAIDNKK